MATPAEQTRFMDNFEKIFSANRINNCGMMLEIEVEEGHKVNMDLLRRAVEETQLRHPHLRVYHDFETGMFKPTPIAEENFQVIPKMTGTWQTFLRERVNEDILDKDGKFSGFRVMVHEESPSLLRMFMIYHHSQADGLSRKNIVNDILTAYDGLLADVNFKHKYLPALPKITDVIFPEGFSEEQNAEIEKLAQEEDAIMRSQVFHLSLPSKDAGPGDDTIYHEGSPEKLKLLLQACHREQVTVGSLAVAATAFAFAKMKKKPLTTDFFYPINLRARLPEIKEHIGLHIICALLRKRVEMDTKLWELARNTTAYVKDYIESGKHFLRTAVTEKDLINIPEIIEQYKKQLCGEDDSNFDNRIVDIGVSNHGIWPSSILKHKALSVKRLHVSGARWSSSVDPICFMIHSINYMSYSMVHRDDTVSRRETQEIMNHVLSIMEEADRLNSDFNLRQFMEEN